MPPSTELVWSRPRSGDLNGERAFGYYGSAEYQFARRWFAGARYDRSAQALDPSLVDKGGSFYLTFWPSEFNQIRGQYRFQLNFSIGAHAAHVF
jgi:hypothetical protein